MSVFACIHTDWKHCEMKQQELEETDREDQTRKMTHKNKSLKRNLSWNQTTEGIRSSSRAEGHKGTEPETIIWI